MRGCTLISLLAGICENLRTVLAGYLRHLRDIFSPLISLIFTRMPADLALRESAGLYSLAICDICGSISPR